MLLGFEDVDNQQKPDSLTDEEGCKSVTSYVLAHKDARIRGVRGGCYPTTAF